MASPRGSGRRIAAGGPQLTSFRAKLSVAALVGGYFAIAVVAGAPNSPLTVLLPARTRPPSWAADLARAIGLGHVARQGLTAVAWALVAVVVVSFVLVLGEAWSRRIGLRTVLVGSGISLAVSVAAPLLLSRDVYTYAAYGRIETLYDRNPYVAGLAAFPHDPYVAVASTQWLHSHSHYGPLFTLASMAIAQAGSPATTILAFKLLAGLAIAIATVLVAMTAVRIRPERAALAAALVGLNPVLVVHTVGGGHVDALLAPALAAATVIAVTRPPTLSARAIAVTALLTAACLIKVVIVPVLVLWVWRLRGRALAAHVAIAIVLSAASIAPFVDGWHTFASFATLGGVEAWASPSHLVGRVAESIFGSAVALKAVEGAFMLGFLVLLARLARRPRSVVGAWGVALLLLGLTLPYLLPWYAAWFAPFIGLFADDAFVLAGALVTVVLGLTLIPADPFHGVTTPAVMDGVHYGAAPVLLVVFLFLAARLLGSGDTKLSTERRDPLKRSRFRPTPARATRSA